MIKDFLPISKNDMKKRNWDSVDFVLVTGDAYVDHSSFGAAIISRLLEAHGYRVGILAQPNWNNVEDFKKFGKPNLGFLITSGNIESMVNHYSVTKNRRKKDLYSPGGISGKRPDRAVVVYSNCVRQAYKDIPIILGGIEASLRRFAHYDYWSDNVRRSILLDSKADLIVYGMGEKAIIEIAEALKSGIEAKYISFIDGTVYKTKDISVLEDYIMLPSYENIVNKKVEFAKSFNIQSKNTDAINGITLIEKYKDWYIAQNKAQIQLPKEELDDIYDLNFMRDFHPIYKKQGGIPAFDEVKFSIIANRGCIGGCNFCALTFHQGKSVVSRSKESIMKEVENLVDNPDFKGYIHDVGGPTANFTGDMCDIQKDHGVCKNKECIDQKPCPNLKISHKEYLDTLKAVRSIEGIKKVFIRSGLRYDYMMYDKDDTFFKEVIQHHISGQLKVAPEHVSNDVLKLMGKPNKYLYNKFVTKFYKLNKELNKNQFLVPYLMSSHPGSTIESAVELALYLKENNLYVEQVQDYYPTPGTISTCMYYTGLNPRTLRTVYIPKDPREKAMQRALIHYRDPKNKEKIKDALIKINRKDLIGNGNKCLVRK